MEKRFANHWPGSKIPVQVWGRSGVRGDHQATVQNACGWTVKIVTQIFGPVTVDWFSGLPNEMKWSFISFHFAQKFDVFPLKKREKSRPKKIEKSSWFFYQSPPKSLNSVKNRLQRSDINILDTHHPTIFNIFFQKF